MQMICTLQALGNNARNSAKDVVCIYFLVDLLSKSDHQCNSLKQDQAKALFIDYNDKFNIS